MEKIISFVSNHKKILLAAAAFIGVVLIFASAIFLRMFWSKGQSEQHNKTTVESSVDSSHNVLDSVTHSDWQKTVIAKYGVREREFIQTLKTYMWVSQTGNTVQFDDGAYIVKGTGAESSWKPLAISALFGQDIVSAAQGGADTAEACIGAILLSNNTTKILSIVPVTIGDRKTLVMTTDGFGSKISYTAQRQEENIHFEGFSDEVNHVLEKDTKDLKDAVANHIKTHFPTASVATLATKATFDFNTHAVSLSFALNDVKKSKIRVMWHRESNRTEFSSGGGG